MNRIPGVPRRVHGAVAERVRVSGPPSSLLVITPPLSSDRRIAHLVVKGEIDLATVDALRARLSVALAAQPASLTLDVSGVTFCGVCGIAVFVETAEACADASAKFFLSGCSKQLRRCLKILDVDGVCGNGGNGIGPVLSGGHAPVR
ncbi:MAG: STAS domain-containing protein [Nakamurella sp.]